MTGMGAFPSIRRPRVIWFGVNAPPEIQDLYLGIDGVCEKLGFESEGDKFSPHLTIGRVSANATPEGIQRISTWFTRNQIGVIGEMQIGTICLYRSDLHPGGAIYTLIEKFPLRS